MHPETVFVWLNYTACICHRSEQLCLCKMCWNKTLWPAEGLLFSVSSHSEPVVVISLLHALQLFTSKSKLKVVSEKSFFSFLFFFFFFCFFFFLYIFFSFLFFLPKSLLFFSFFFFFFDLSLFVASADIFPFVSHTIPSLRESLAACISIEWPCRC